MGRSPSQLSPPITWHPRQSDKKNVSHKCRQSICAAAQANYGKKPIPAVQALGHLQATRLRLGVDGIAEARQTEGGATRPAYVGGVETSGQKPNGACCGEWRQPFSPKPWLAVMTSRRLSPLRCRQSLNFVRLIGVWNLNLSEKIEKIPQNLIHCNIKLVKVSTYLDIWFVNNKYSKFKNS
jgi:hypothetical protein